MKLLAKSLDPLSSWQFPVCPGGALVWERSGADFGGKPARFWWVFACLSPSPVPSHWGRRSLEVVQTWLGFVWAAKWPIDPMWSCRAGSWSPWPVPSPDYEAWKRPSGFEGIKDERSSFTYLFFFWPLVEMPVGLLTCFCALGGPCLRGPSSVRGRVSGPRRPHCYSCSLWIRGFSSGGSFFSGTRVDVS
jgi:hypothetical protein